MIRKYTKHEIFYLFKSGIAPCVFLVICLIYWLALFMNYKSVLSIYSEYKREVAFAQDVDNDEDSDEFEYTEENGVVTVENPVAYYKQQVGKFAFAATPKYTLTQLLEFSQVAFAFVFGTLGIICGTYDYKYKTIKTKMVRMSKNTYFLSKQTAMIMTSVFAATLGLVFGKIFGYIEYLLLKKNFNFNEFDISGYTVSHMGLKILLTALVLICYLEIGFFLGNLLSNSFLSIIILYAGIIFVGDKLKYGLGSSIRQLYHGVFEYYGIVKITGSLNHNNLLSIMVFMAFMGFSGLMSCAIIKKRTGYIS